MKRKDFIKLTTLGAAALALPNVPAIANIGKTKGEIMWEKIQKLPKEIPMDYVHKYIDPNARSCGGRFILQCRLYEAHKIYQNGICINEKEITESLNSYLPSNFFYDKRLFVDVYDNQIYHVQKDYYFGKEGWVGPNTFKTNYTYKLDMESSSTGYNGCCGTLNGMGNQFYNFHEDIDRLLKFCEKHELVNKIF